MNSIIDSQSKESIISAIKLELHHPSSPNLFIVVEGPDDLIFLNSMLDEVNIYRSFSGKCGVIEILNTIQSKHVVGICDRDYDSEDYERIFYYDEQSLETMLVSTGKIFDKVLDSFHCYKKSEKDEFKTNVYLCAYPISIMRKESISKKMKINFQGIKPSHYIMNESCSVDKLINRCIEINGNIDDDLRTLMSATDLTLYKINELHGNDLISIIAHFLNKKLNKGVSNEIVAQFFRAAYMKDDFKLTNLYNQIRQYKFAFIE